MPYKKGSLKGQLTTAEIRKLISAHNKLSKITIPPRSTRDTIMKIISKAGFRVNHGEEKLEQTKATKKDISLEKAKDITKRVPKTEEQKKKATERKQEKQVQKEKELKLAKKEGVKEFKQKKAEAQKKKPEPKKKTTTMGTQTDEKPKPKKKQVKKEKVLAIEDKNDEVQSLKENRCGRAVAHATSIIRFYEEYNGILKDFPDYKTKKELIEDYEDLKKGEFGDCTQEEQATIRKAIKLHENPPKKKGKVKQAVEKIEKPAKTEKSFKVERTERSQMINQLSSEMGKKFNPFKILGITAREETPELVKKKCRELRLKNHPDKGGDKNKFDLIQKACDILLKTQTILKKKSGNDKDKGEAVKKPDEKKVGRPVGSKTILNFSKLKRDNMNKLFKEIGVDRENWGMKENREVLKSLFTGEDFKLKETIKKEEYDKLSKGVEIFYREREKREKKEGYTLTSGLGIYDVDNKDNIGKDKKYFIDKINKFMDQK